MTTSSVVSSSPVADATTDVLAVLKKLYAAWADQDADAFADLWMLGDDAAVVVSRAGILMAGESEVPAARERIATCVLAKRDGVWWIAAYCNVPANVPAS